MGQQQTVAGGALRRMILVLAVAALMAAMMVATAVPAFAVSPSENGKQKACFHANHTLPAGFCS
jgi:hypothetical protein